MIAPMAVIRPARRSRMTKRPAAAAMVSQVRPYMPTTEAICDISPPAIQLAPGRSQGNPLRIWPRSHSNPDRAAAKSRTRSGEGPLNARKAAPAAPQNKAMNMAVNRTANGAIQPWFLAST